MEEGKWLNPSPKAEVEVHILVMVVGMAELAVMAPAAAKEAVAVVAREVIQEMAVVAVLAEQVVAVGIPQGVQVVAAVVVAVAAVNETATPIMEAVAAVGLDYWVRAVMVLVVLYVHLVGAVAQEVVQEPMRHTRPEQWVMAVTVAVAVAAELLRTVSFMPSTLVPVLVAESASSGPVALVRSPLPMWREAA